MEESPETSVIVVEDDSSRVETGKQVYDTRRNRAMDETADEDQLLLNRTNEESIINVDYVSSITSPGFFFFSITNVLFYNFFLMQVQEPFIIFTVLAG